MDVEKIVKSVGLLVLVVGAFQGYLAYVQSAKLQAMRALHSEQLQVCSSLVSASSELLTQNTSEAYKKAFDIFANLKHGNALVFLDPDTIDKAVDVYNAAIEPLSHNNDDSLRHEIRCALGNKPFELALSCRNLISGAYTNESGGALSPISSDYTMGWVGSCE